MEPFGFPQGERCPHLSAWQIGCARPIYKSFMSIISDAELSGMMRVSEDGGRSVL